MISPEERQIQSQRNLSFIPQPNFDGALAAAAIPQVEIPEHLDAPVRFPMPVIPLLPAFARRQSKAMIIPSESVTGYSRTSVPLPETLNDNIPQVELPLGWDRPLENPIPTTIPPPPIPVLRGKSRQPLETNINEEHSRILAQLAQDRQKGKQRQIDVLLRQQEQQQEAELEKQMEFLRQQQTQESEARRQSALAEELRHLEVVEQNQDRQRANAEAAQRMMQQFRAEQEAELDQEDENSHQNQIDQDQEYAQRLFEQFQAQMTFYGEQERQDALAAANLAAQQYQESMDQDNALRLQIEPEQPDLPIPIRQNIPKGCIPYQEPPEIHHLGPMNIQCSHCNALHFDSEKLSSSTIRNKKFGMCCLQGQIKLPPLRPAPNTLKILFNGISPLSKSFKDNIRQYNAAFAFTSLGVKIDHTVTSAAGSYSFKISGELHHLSGALLPQENQPEVYAQIYIHDPAQQIGMKQSNYPNLHPVIIAELQAMVHEMHPYVALYKQAFQIMREKPIEEQQTVYIKLHTDRTLDQRRYNLPTADEIAAIIPGDGSEECSDHRDIVLRLHGGGLKRISHLHPSYSSLHYVLLFPSGEDGWHPNIPSLSRAQGAVRCPKVSQRCYYAYRLHVKPGIQPPLFWGGKLFQQYVVDAWASIEQSLLNWIRHHQKELRDAAVGDTNQNLDLSNHGQRIIVPSTHIGSERYMNQLFQDSMAICRAFKKPDIFFDNDC